MKDWYRIQIKCTTNQEHIDKIKNVLSPAIKVLEDNKDIISFFILNEAPSNDGKLPQRIMFMFYGDKDKVENKLKELQPTIALLPTEPYDPKTGEAYHFAGDYMLGVRLFEIGTRFALAKLDGHKPADTSIVKTGVPILLTFRHGFCNNLGIDENQPAIVNLDRALFIAYNTFLS